jgi:hypothetical protein
MKHIKLFEEISSVMPSKHTADSIRSMSVDDLERAIEIYHREGNKDEANSVISIWLDSNPWGSLSMDDMTKFTDFMEKYPDLGSEERFADRQAMAQNIKMGGNTYKLESEIKELEIRVAQKKALLQRIKGL